MSTLYCVPVCVTEKLIVTHLVEMFPHFVEPKYIIVFTKAHHLILC
jgi:hypothetical protein